MDINLTLLGQMILASFLAATVASFWYFRRSVAHSTIGALLVVFAWIVPIIGPIGLMIFLAALPNSVANETVVSNTNDSP